METITLKVFSFDELNEKAKKTLYKGGAMKYLAQREVYSVHYTTDTERGTMRLAGPDLATVREYFARHYPGHSVDLIERFSLRA